MKRRTGNAKSATKRTNRYRRSAPLACLTRILTSSPHNLTPNPFTQAEAAAAKEAEMNRKHSPKHSPKDSPKDSPKHSPKHSPKRSDTLAGAPAPLPLWEKMLRKARPSPEP